MGTLEEMNATQWVTLKELAMTHVEVYNLFKAINMGVPTEEAILDILLTYIHIADEQKEMLLKMMQESPHPLSPKKFSP